MTNIHKKDGTFFKVGDHVHSNFNSKRDNIWYVAKVANHIIKQKNSPHWNEQDLTLKLVFAAGSTKPRTLLVRGVACNLVTDKFIEEMICNLKKDIKTLSDIKLG